MVITGPAPRLGWRAGHWLNWRIDRLRLAIWREATPQNIASLSERDPGAGRTGGQWAFPGPGWIGPVLYWAVSEFALLLSWQTLLVILARGARDSARERAIVSRLPEGDLAGMAIAAQRAILGDEPPAVLNRRQLTPTETG